MAARTNGDIYELVDDRISKLRLEIKDDMRRLTTDVTKQLSELTKSLNQLDGNQRVDATRIGMLVIGLTIAVNGVIAFVVDKLTGKAL